MIEFRDIHWPMARESVIARLHRLGWTRSRLLAEASLWLALSSAMIAMLSFRSLAAILKRGGDRAGCGMDRPALIEDTLRAIRSAAPRLPWRTVCFQQGVALHWMLRRRGVASRLHYGVRQDRENGLTAHVWVSIDGANVLGGENASEFSCLATFPDRETDEGHADGGRCAG